MIKYVKQSLQYTNKHIIIATPLILFSLFSSIYLLFSIKGSIVGLFISAFLFFLMTSAFLSGWFYMIAKIVKDENNEEPNALIKEFPAGVGEYILSVMGLIICLFIIISTCMTIAYVVGIKYIGPTGISPDAFTKASESIAALKVFASSLTSDQLAKLNLWNLLIFSTLALSYFALIFSAPTLFFKTKNPIKAVLFAIKDVVTRQLFKNILMFVLVFTSYIIISILSTLSSANNILYFIFTLVYFYYISFLAIFIFNFYYKNYMIVGSQIDELV